MVPPSRIHVKNAGVVRRRGDYVLYWMLGARRLRYNQGLERALHWADELGLPLVVLEALNVDYPFAADRHHALVIDGMADKVEPLAQAGVRYHPYVEPSPGAGKGLLEAWWARAAVVVTDEAPLLFLPRLVAAAAARCPCRLEAVDSVGLVPLSAVAAPHSAAVHFRRAMQKIIAGHLVEAPQADPLAGRVGRLAAAPEGLFTRWPAASPDLLARGPGALAALPIDHSVAPVGLRGGPVAAEARLQRFLRQGLPKYAEERSDVVADRASGLSPYLHHGQIAAWEVFDRVAASVDWSIDRMATKATASREGFWGMGPAAESFIDELIVWRELGYTTAYRMPDCTSYESLPAWARATLDAHRDDPRPVRYGFEQLNQAETHDPVWNAAQRQLRRDGIIHNYLRMLWGKKIIEWTPSPEVALETMFSLNNRFATDGRDPNSVSGITWCMGRYDRPWAPVRPIFGSIRYMSSDSTMKKMKLAPYLAEYAR
jgi:deoxyribodipyrimidine photo-lyase